MALASSSRGVPEIKSNNRKTKYMETLKETATPAKSNSFLFIISLRISMFLVFLPVLQVE
jgi:hypothetical protein